MLWFVINVLRIFVGLIIFLSGILILIRTAALSKNLSNPLELGATWESFAFVACKLSSVIFDLTKDQEDFDELFC